MSKLCRVGIHQHIHGRILDHERKLIWDGCICIRGWHVCRKHEPTLVATDWTFDAVLAQTVAVAKYPRP